jgi:hypothetical protein
LEAASQQTMWMPVLGSAGREAANAVGRSRSKISTCSKYCAKAPAIDSPPIPPPTTTARRPKRLLMLLRSYKFGTGRSLQRKPKGLFAH